MRLALVLILLASSAHARSTASIDSIAPGISMMIHEEPASKSIVAEFDRFVVVIESPGDEENARQLLTTLDAAYPDKPVRFVLHTHHHGHSLGALDPWLVRGATIVTTDQNLELVRGRSADADGFADEALVVGDGFSIADASNRLVVHVLDRADYTIPTEQYVVVEFPTQELLVSGCLYNKPLDYHEVVNARKPALRHFLERNTPDVHWLIPTNTSEAKGFENVCTVDMLDATLEEGIKPHEVFERLAALELDAIEAQLDDLAVEFAARTPRAYDLLVTGNTIRAEEDFARAALWFEMTARVFPDDARARYYLGVARWENGEAEAAEEAWNEAVARADDDLADRIRSGAAGVRAGS